MGYLYRTVGGTKPYVQDEIVSSKLTLDRDTALDALVLEKILTRTEVPQRSEDASAAIAKGKLVRIATGQLAMVAGPCTDWVGVLLAAVARNAPGYYAFRDNVVLEASDVAIAAGKMLVGAPEGRVAEYQASAVNLMTSVQGAATGDFDNSVWLAAGEVIRIKASANAAGTRGNRVEFHFINDLNLYDTEIITTSSSDATSVVAGLKKCKKLLAIKVLTAFVDGNLIVEDVDGNDCIALTTPTADTWYGQILTDDSDDAKGQQVKLTCGDGALTGKILVVGTDYADAAQTEIVTFTAAATAVTTKAWKTITALLIGDDGTATATWSIEVSANTAAQIVGVAREAIPARTHGLVTMQTKYGRDGTIYHDYAGAHADWTLTADEEEADTIVVSNSDQSANIIATPIPGKKFLVVNLTTANIVIKASGQTGITIATLKSAMVRGTGADFARATADA